MSPTEIIEAILRGVSSGSIYALVALGYNVIFATTNILNFAHGEMFMLGTLLAFMLWVLLGVPLVLALVLVVIAVALMGVLTERLAIRPVLKVSGSWGWLLSTLGFGIVVRRLAEIISGNEPLPMPAILPDRPYDVLGVGVNPQYMLAVVTALAVTAGMHAFFGRTMLGKAIVATAQDRDAASLRGINVLQMGVIAFAIGSAIAGLTGFVVAPVTFAYASVGALFAMKGFVASAAGGIGSNLGALLGGLTLGLIEEFGIVLVGAGYRDTLAVVFLLAIMLLRPQGFFGTTAAREV